MRILIIATVAACLVVGTAQGADAPLYKTRDCGKEMVQMAMNQCAGENLEAGNAELNSVYNRLMGQQTDQASKNQLKDLERAWIAYRDKECNFEIGPQSQGGSIWPMDMSTCLEQKTDTHIRELKAMSN